MGSWRLAPAKGVDRPKTINNKKGSYPLVVRPCRRVAPQIEAEMQMKSESER